MTASTVDVPRLSMPKDRKPATATIKIDPDLLRKAQQIAAFTEDADGGTLKLSDYFDSLLRAPIERDHAKLLKRLAKDQTKPGE